jgi:hypothetical protein
MAAVKMRDPETRWQALRVEMERNAYHLGRRGSIVAEWVSGGRRWVLRFAAPDRQGRLVHRSLYLSSEDAAEIVQRARTLLQHYRTLSEGLAEIPVLARLGARAVAPLRGRWHRAATAGATVALRRCPLRSAFFIDALATTH